MRGRIGAGGRSRPGRRGRRDSFSRCRPRQADRRRASPSVGTPGVCRPAQPGNVPVRPGGITIRTPVSKPHGHRGWWGPSAGSPGFRPGLSIPFAPPPSISARLAPWRRRVAGTARRSSGPESTKRSGPRVIRSRRRPGSPTRAPGVASARSRYLTRWQACGIMNV